MKNLYKRKAYLLDDDKVIEGYTDKYGFHPTDPDCGFTIQKFRKKDINRIIFYTKHRFTVEFLKTLRAKDYPF